MLQVAINGGHLGLWGISLLLLWVAVQRLWNMAHVQLAAQGCIAPPRIVYSPVPRVTDGWWSALAATTGAAGVFAFTIPAAEFVPFLSIPATASPLFELGRVLLIFVLLLLLLVRVSMNPIWKLKWGLAWFCFSLIVAALS